MITLIAAMSRNRVIGNAGKLPWGHGSMTADQDRFRQLIRHQVIVIGRGTFNPDDDYIQNAKFVYLLTSQDASYGGNIRAIDSIQPVLQAAQTQDVFVVGGAGVFAELIDYADKLELTYVEANYDGDKFFPKFDKTDWQVVAEESHSADKSNTHPYKFVTLTRK